LPTRATEERENIMGLLPGFVIQPSADAKATAIAVAWIISNRAGEEGEKESSLKSQADLVGELAGRIISGASTRFEPLNEFQ
jgi:hypothetical protein